jgi:hypothetical protein
LPATLLFFCVITTTTWAMIFFAHVRHAESAVHPTGSNHFFGDGILFFHISKIAPFGKSGEWENQRGEEIQG